MKEITSAYFDQTFSLFSITKSQHANFRHKPLVTAVARQCLFLTIIQVFCMLRAYTVTAEGNYGRGLLGYKYYNV